MYPDDSLTTWIRRLARVVRWSLVIGPICLAVTTILAIGTLGVGIYDLKITVTSESAARIRDVHARACEFEQAQSLLLRPGSRPNLPNESEGGVPFDGQSLSIPVWFTCETWCLGLIRTQSHRRFLLVVVDYDDGRQVRKILGIPHRSVTEQVEVDVP
jgi:hypothetical protein